jgi:hypothetical protein
MSDLRKTWGAAKMLSEDEFKKAHAAEMKHAHEGGLTPYPLKFNKDLGPTLDKYEAAKKAKKATDMAAHKKKALEVMKIYDGLAETNKKALGEKPYKALKAGLKLVGEGLA